MGHVEGGQGKPVRVSYTLVWEMAARRALRRLHQTDEAGAVRMEAVVGALAADPRPVGARPLGTSGWFRLYVDNHRATYHLDEETRTVLIVHVGSVIVPG